MYTLLKVLTDPNYNPTQLSLIFILCAGYCLASITFINMAVKRDQLASFFTQLKYMDTLWKSMPGNVFFIHL